MTKAIYLDGVLDKRQDKINQLKGNLYSLSKEQSQIEKKISEKLQEYTYSEIIKLKKELKAIGAQIRKIYTKLKSMGENIELESLKNMKAA